MYEVVAITLKKFVFESDVWGGYEKWVLILFVLGEVVIKLEIFREAGILI